MVIPAPDVLPDALPEVFPAAPTTPTVEEADSEEGALEAEPEADGTDGDVLPAALLPEEELPEPPEWPPEMLGS